MVSSLEIPLSHCLLVLVMEAVSNLLSRVVECGFISGFRVEGRVEGVQISHSDDTLTFCDPCLDQFSFSACWFEASSSLNINLSESELIPIGFVPNVKELALVMGWGIGKLCATYFSLPLKAKATRDVVKERCSKRLTLWKRQHLRKVDESLC